MKFLRRLWYSLSYRTRNILSWLGFGAILFLVWQQGLPNPVPQTIESRRAYAVDGDSLNIGKERIRLQYIDAPERAQNCRRSGKSWPCGKQAQAKLRKLTRRRLVRCESNGLDRYQRILATCYTKNQKTSINEQMVRSGYAVASGYRFDLAEEKARRARLGLWSGQFDHPRDWRRLNAQTVPTNLWGQLRIWLGWPISSGK